MNPQTDRRRVVLLTGPSGSGKSRLATRLHRRHGWPIIHLDDFYRDGDDPQLPCHRQLGIPDWDDPASWDAVAAVRALTDVIDTGHARTPRYDIATSRAVGTQDVAARPGDLVLAEGIFAAEIVDALTAAGLLHSAWSVIHRHRLQTFCWRLARDLREHRKPPHILVRRGWALMQAQPGLVARQRALGATAATAAQIERRLEPGVTALG